MDDAFKLLQCDENGLTKEEATRRLEIFGPNKLESEEQNAFLQVRSSSLSSLVPFVQVKFPVFEFYVESPLMGHGGRRTCCYRFV